MVRLARIGLGAVVILVLLATALSPGSAFPGTAAAQAQADDGWRCVIVTGQGGLNIRSGPGVNFEIVTTLAPLTELEANYQRATTADNYNWVPVRYTGGTGWAITPRLGPCPGEDTGEQNVVLEGVNQDGVLDRFEIAEVGRSVVLIANLQRGRIRATGTGTIITPDGLVITNAHVVEDAEEIAIGLLNDINDPAELLYKAELIGIDPFIDVALLAIRTDLNDRPVNVQALNLPYIPASLRADAVFRGDPIYIFGYPGIGDDYLVVTQGTIVSVENGDINSQRLPVWYRTDAEIAPGNSGGLVVNGNGEFVGIPTVVTAEEQTGGRLGGIRPAEVAVMAVLDEESVIVVAPDATPDTTDSLEPDPGLVKADLLNVALEHTVEQGSVPGMRVTVTFSLSGWDAEPVIVFARVYTDTIDSHPLTNPSAPPEYRDPDGVVWAVARLDASGDPARFDDVALFLPYSALGITTPGNVPLKLQVGVSAPDGTWTRTLSWEFIEYTRS